MQLKTYLNLYALLLVDKSTVEERRAFGLEHSNLKKDPVAQLSAWSAIHQHRLSTPLLSETFSSYLYGITLVLAIVAFIFGAFSGVALLSYNGHEPVNVVYFMAMVILLPLFTMLLALFSMLRANSAKSVLVHLSPSFWMEKILQFLPLGLQKKLEDFQMNPLLANWIVIRRSQLIALFFSLGLFVALIFVVATKDIAFAWSTTLQISAESFHHFLSMITLPWSEWVPSAVPTQELIEQSQYFRLGDRLSEEMITHASKLGEWWKFLAMSTLFYAIFLRFIMYLLASVGLKKALKKSFLALDGASKLLRELNDPIISTSAPIEETEFVSSSSRAIPMIHRLESTYTSVQGWAIPKEKLIVINDAMNIVSDVLYEVGGGNTLAEDYAIINNSQGTVLLYVKAWEPPTMDFIDYLEALAAKVDKIIVYPIGTQEEDYKPKSKFVDIWERKIAALEEEKIWLKRVQKPKKKEA